jgi:hypothetical protein
LTLPDTDSFATYGGSLQNYAPVEDPTTDRDALAANQAYASIAAATHTVARAWARFVTSATTPSLATTNGNDANWGNSLGVQPTPARVSTGVFTLTWPSTIVDENGGTHTVNLRRAFAQPEGATLYNAQALVTAPNIVTVYTFTAAGSANDIAGVTVHVEVG